LAYRQERSIGAKRDASHSPLNQIQIQGQLPGGDVPHVHFPPEPFERMEASASGENLAIGAECTTTEGALVPFQGSLCLPRRHVPNGYRLVPSVVAAPRCQ